jgi:hypothetical protein
LQGLVGLGPQFWSASQAVRDAACEAKQQEFEEWALANPEIVMDVCHSGAAKAHYDAAIAVARQKYTALGDEAAAAAARAQLDVPSVGGLRLQRNLFSENNGVYQMVGMHEGWPHFLALNGSQHLFHRPYENGRGPEWILCKYFDPAGDISNGRIPCDGGRLPLGGQQWMTSQQSGKPQAVMMLEWTIVSPDEVTTAKEVLQAERAAAQSALLAQLEGKTVLTIAGSSNDYLNGRFTRVEEDYDGWPHFISDKGVHLFRHLPTNSWRVSATLGPKPVSESTLQGMAMDGHIPLAEGWWILRGLHWEQEVNVSVSLM